jgi:hypothetical protein
MTGPEHFREAEGLLALARESKETTFEGHNPEADRTIAEAHVHAVLAQVALTALAMPLEGQDDSPSLSQEDYDEWLVAIELEGKQGTDQMTCSQCPREVRPGRTYCSTYCRTLADTEAGA